MRAHDDRRRPQLFSLGADDVANAARVCLRLEEEAEK